MIGTSNHSTIGITKNYKKMEITNTLENKAKFFAQYFGQRFLLWHEHSPIFNLLVEDFKSDTFSNYLLQLTPISQITDEDAYNAGITKARLKNHINHPHIMTPFMCDYLRSKGYALPWMGLSVEQLVSFGWVKLKEG